MGQMLNEFKEFALKGNVIDMAIGVVIGGAFGKETLVQEHIIPAVAGAVASEGNHTSGFHAAAETLFDDPAQCVAVNLQGYPRLRLARPGRAACLEMRCADQATAQIVRQCQICLVVIPHDDELIAVQEPVGFLRPVFAAALHAQKFLQVNLGGFGIDEIQAAIRR